MNLRQLGAHPRRFLAEAFAWLLPLIVVLELVGTTFGDAVRSTLGLLLLFLGIFWLSPAEPRAAAAPPPRWARITAIALGAVCLLAGALAVGVGVLRILEPKKIPITELPLFLREREGYLLLPLLAAWPLALGPRLIRGRRDARDHERVGLGIALVFLALLAQKYRNQGLFVLPYDKPWLGTVLVVLAVVLGLLMVVPKVPPLARFAVIVAAGVTLRWIGLSTWQIDPGVRDMLPLVKSAQDAFFSGHNPYAFHQMQRGSVVPLTYLPGMWLGWGVPRLAGLDFRVWGIVADVAVAVGLWWAAGRADEPQRSWGRGIAAGFAAAWFFSPSLMWNGIYAEPHAWWGVLAVVLAALLRRRWWLAMAALGVALATRHFALVLVPFVTIALIRDVGWRAAVPRLALTGAVAAVLLVPFVARDPDTFWFGTFHWLVEYGPVHQSWFWEKYGFSGPLYKAHATEWMPRAQAAIVVLMALVATRVRGPRKMIAPLGTAYVVFVMFNGIIWDSFYLGAALFAAFAAAGGAPAGPHALPQTAPPGRRRFIAGGVVLGAAAFAGLWLLWSLRAATSKVGEADARAHLEQTLAPGQAYVDLSSYRLAFVRGSLLLPRTAARVGTSLFDPRLGFAGIFGFDRATVVLRHARDESAVAELLAAGVPRDDVRFGRFRVATANQLKLERRLSAEPFGVTLAASPGAPPEALPKNGTAFASPSITFVQVVPKNCRIEGALRPMLYAHPAAGGELTVAWNDVELGRALAIVGGLEDSAVVWGRAAVDVRVRLDAKDSGRLHLKNLPYEYVTVVDTSKLGPGKHRVELTLTTANDNQRLTCVDGYVLR